MGLEAPRRCRSWFVTIAVVLVFLGLLTSGLFVVGLGAFLFLRTQSRQSLVVAEQERAIAQQLQAQIQLERARQQAEQDISALLERPGPVVASPTSPLPASAPPVVLDVAADGQLRWEGETIDRQALAERLSQLSSRSGPRRPLQLRMELESPGDVLVNVLAACRAAGTREIHVLLLDE